MRHMKAEPVRKFYINTGSIMKRAVINTKCTEKLHIAFGTSELSRHTLDEQFYGIGQNKDSS